MITAYLYKNNKKILCGCWEDLIDFVEALKRDNNELIDRREFKVLFIDNTLCKKWRCK